MNSWINCQDVHWVFIEDVSQSLWRGFLVACDEVLRQNENKFLPLWLNSEGGDYYAYLAIRDYINDLKSKGIPVVTINTSYWGSQSAGLSLYAMGDLRYATPSAHWLLHTVSCSYRPGKGDSPNLVTNISLEEPNEEKLRENITKMTDTLFTHLSDDLNLNGKETVYSFLEKHSKGTNETIFGLEIADELGLYTHTGIPNKERILKDINDINKK